MADFSPYSRVRGRRELLHAIDAATARLVSATHGDFSAPAPLVVMSNCPELADALNGLFADVRARFDRVNRLAMFDPVTSLPNRTYFRQEAEQILRSLPIATKACLFFIDLDNFKSVNDTYGHAQGDQLLAQVARRFRDVADPVGGVALVGRLAGDEFTLLFDNVDGVSGARIIGRDLLAAMTKPFEISGYKIDLGASIGIALRSDGQQSLTELMRAADVAMYQAKAKGRRQFQFYSEKLAEQLAARSQLDNDLRTGITRNELALLVQPQISLIDGALVAAEALLRWHHPTRGTMVPHQFLAAAEESGLIFDISGWSLAEAARIAAAWKQRKTKVRLAINLGSRQMNQADFFPGFRANAAALQVPMDIFEIEVTEANMMECGDTVITALSALRSEGARITIDTAGIGMSSLAQLRVLPIDRIKLHRSVIADITIDPRAQAVAQAMIGLGHGLGCDVIAAGVETAEQIDILRVMGCDAVQGFAIAPPMSLEAFSHWRSGSKKRAKTRA